MKQAIGGGLAVISIAWLLFVFAPEGACERVKRGAAPVRAAMDLARWAGTNWLSIEARIDMLRWSLKADTGTQRFLSKQFYGTQVCEAPAAASTSSSADEPAAPKEGQH